MNANKPSTVCAGNWRRFESSGVCRTHRPREDGESQLVWSTPSETKTLRSVFLSLRATATSPSVIEK